MHKQQKKIVAHLIQQNIFPIVLGGGHDISYPNIVGFSTNKKEFAVINLDAHTDVRPLI